MLNQSWIHQPSVSGGLKLYDPIEHTGRDVSTYSHHKAAERAGSRLLFMEAWWANHFDCVNHALALFQFKGLNLALMRAFHIRDLLIRLLLAALYSYWQLFQSSKPTGSKEPRIMWCKSASRLQQSPYRAFIATENQARRSVARFLGFLWWKCKPTTMRFRSRLLLPVEP